MKSLANPRWQIGLVSLAAILGFLAIASAANNEPLVEAAGWSLVAI